MHFRNLRKKEGRQSPQKLQHRGKILPGWMVLWHAVSSTWPEWSETSNTALRNVDFSLHQQRGGSTNMLISAPSNGGEPERLERSAELLQIAAKICQPLLSQPPLRMQEGGCLWPILFFCVFYGFLWPRIWSPFQPSLAHNGQKSLINCLYPSVYLSS